MKTAKGWFWPDADQFMVNELKEDGSYQGSHLTEALRFVTDFSVALDGGAHVGTWSRTLSSRFKQVVAVEPSGDTYEALCANMRQFGCANVDAKRAALGDALGRVQMAIETKAQAMENTGARFVKPGNDVIMLTIDGMDLQSLGFLKLDVEGSEYAALNGARDTLARCQPVVLFENKFLWKRYGVPRDAPQQLLTGLGYRKASSVSKDEIWVRAR